MSKPLNNTMNNATIIPPKAIPVGMPLHVNDTVKVQLTDYGRKMLRHGHAPRSIINLPREDADGWSTWQLWSLMEDIGPYTSLCGPYPMKGSMIVVQNV